MGVIMPSKIAVFCNQDIGYVHLSKDSISPSQTVGEIRPITVEV